MATLLRKVDSVQCRNWESGLAGQASTMEEVGNKKQEVAMLPDGAQTAYFSLGESSSI